MATTGGRGTVGSVGRQMVCPRWDERVVGEGQQQGHVDVSDDQGHSSSSQHSGSEEERRAVSNGRKLFVTFEQP